MVIRVRNAETSNYLKLKPKYANVLADKHKFEGIIFQLRRVALESNNLQLEQAAQLGHLTLVNTQKSDQIKELRKVVALEDRKWSRGVWTFIGAVGGFALGSLTAGLVLILK